MVGFPPTMMDKVEDKGVLVRFVKKKRVEQRKTDDHNMQ